MTLQNPEFWIFELKLNNSNLLSLLLPNKGQHNMGNGICKTPTTEVIEPIKAHPTIVTDSVTDKNGTYYFNYYEDEDGYMMMTPRSRDRSDSLNEEWWEEHCPFYKEEVEKLDKLVSL